jgi:hypothetical protein
VNCKSFKAFFKNYNLESIRVLNNNLATIEIKKVIEIDLNTKEVKKEILVAFEIKEVLITLCSQKGGRRA